MQAVLCITDLELHYKNCSHHRLMLMSLFLHGLLAISDLVQIKDLNTHTLPSTGINLSIDLNEMHWIYSLADILHILISVL